MPKPRKGKTMKATSREITFTITVIVPAATGENEVSNAINAALEEPPCDWGVWTVGAALITDVKRVPTP
jgi:hypothetical protein